MKCVRYRMIQIHKMFRVLTLPIYPAVYRARHSVVAHHIRHPAIGALWNICRDICTRPIIPAQGLRSASLRRTAEPYLSQSDHGDVRFCIRGTVNLPFSRVAGISCISDRTPESRHIGHDNVVASHRLQGQARHPVQDLRRQVLPFPLGERHPVLPLRDADSHRRRASGNIRTH